MLWSWEEKETDGKNYLGWIKKILNVSKEHNERLSIFIIISSKS